MLVKDAERRFGTSRYVALYNSGDREHEFVVRAGMLDLGGRIEAFDLVERADCGCFEDKVSVRVAPHAAKFYRFDAAQRKERSVYEAETAFLTDYQELRDVKEARTAHPAEDAAASGGVAVRMLGGRPTNDLVFPEVRIERDGLRTLEIRCSTPERREFLVQVDGGTAHCLAVDGTEGGFASVSLSVDLSAGTHAVRLLNPVARMPDIDCLIVR